MSKDMIIAMMDELRLILHRRSFLTNTSARSKTRDRLEFLGAQLEEAKCHWQMGSYEAAAIKMRSLNDPKAFLRCWRAAKGENVMKVCAEKADALRLLDDLADFIGFAAGRLEAAKKAAGGASLEPKIVDEIISRVGKRLGIQYALRADAVAALRADNVPVVHDLVDGGGGGGTQTLAVH